MVDFLTRQPEASCDGYTKIARLGTGGTASVYLVEKNAKKYAMKKMKLPEDDPQRKQALLEDAKREYDIISKLNQANVAGIPICYDFQVDRTWLKSNG